MRPFLPALLLASSAAAHAVISTVLVDGKRIGGDGTCIRMDMDGETTTGPIADVTGDDMACGRDGNSPVAFVCPAQAGSTVTLEYRSLPNKAVSDAGTMPASHKGPCAFYLKKIDDDDEAKVSATGPGWFKIFDLGYDPSQGLWCTEIMIKQDGLFSVDIPSGLQAGNYLFRAEMLGLQEAYEGEPQFYVNCVQIFITSGSASPDGLSALPADRTVSIPGYIDGTEPGVTFDIFKNPAPSNYPLFGPKAWYPVAGDGAPTELKKQSVGVIPDDCVMINGNWCAAPLGNYTTVSECWSTIDNCYAQGQDCYNTSPPTGSINCDNWEGMCNKSEDKCRALDDHQPAEEVPYPESADIPPPTSYPGGVQPSQDCWVNVDGSAAATKPKIKTCRRGRRERRGL